MGSKNVHLLDLEQEKVIQKIVTADADVEEIYKVLRKDSLVYAFFNYFYHEDIRSFYGAIEDDDPVPSSYFTYSGTQGITWNSTLSSCLESVDSTYSWTEDRVNKVIKILGIPFDFDRALELI